MTPRLSSRPHHPSRSLPLLAASLLIGSTAHAEDRTAGIDRIFDFATPQTPGCVCAVSRNGERVLNRAYGLADVARKLPMSTNSKLDIGSVQKQFTAAAVLLLVQDGRVALSDDIRKHLPELPDYGHKVTVDHLLTHTSGVRDWPGLLPMAEDSIDVLKLIMRQRGLNFAPGEEWSYSNSGFELLKEMVARVSGMPLAEFERRRLFEPLGMKSAAYVPDILQGTGERALAYRKDGAGWKPFMRLGRERGGGAVIATAADLLIWNDALTTGRLGKLVTEKLHEPTRLNNGRKLRYGRGLVLDSIPGGRLVWHSGGAAGYSTWLGRFTDRGLSIAVMCNFEPLSTSPLVTRVADLFLPRVDPRAKPPGPVGVPGVDVSGKEGLFVDARTGDPMRLVADGDGLSIANGPPLVAVATDRFQPLRTSPFFRSQDEFEITFRSNDEFELESMEGLTSLFRRAQPYSPTAADLQSVDGRYFSEEIGTVFEVVPGSSELQLRFEREPEKALSYQPLDRDTYVRNLAVIRFRRDASGKVVALESSTPVVRNLRFERLGDRIGAR